MAARHQASGTFCLTFSPNRLSLCATWSLFHFDNLKLLYWKELSQGHSMSTKWVAHMNECAHHSLSNLGNGVDPMVSLRIVPLTQNITHLVHYDPWIVMFCVFIVVVQCWAFFVRSQILRFFQGCQLFSMVFILPFAIIQLFAGAPWPKSSIWKRKLMTPTFS